MIQTLKISEIKFERHADVTEEVRVLADSIKEQGLLHPITVNNVQELNNKVLITGMKRLLACKSLGMTEIPCEVLDNLDSDAVASVHIQENLKRYNLPWYEQVDLERQLHELRQKQHGGKSGQGRPKAEEAGWTVRDTARELGEALGTVSQDIQLARAVQADPALRNVKDKKTAFKLIKMRAKQSEASKVAGLSDNEFKYNEIYHGDSSEILKLFEPDLFDVAITDPPWITYKEKALTQDENTLPVFKELFRVLR